MRTDRDLQLPDLTTFRAGQDAVLGLLGEHQCSNAATAVTAALLLRRQGWNRIDGAAVLAGLKAAHLPGRFQVQPFAQPVCPRS